MLSKVQKEFLRLRPEFPSDDETARAVGYSTATAHSIHQAWKTKNPEFLIAYQQVMEGTPYEESVDINATQDLQAEGVVIDEAMRDVESAMQQQLPWIVEQHLAMIRNATSDQSKAALIRMAYELAGVYRKSDMPNVQKNFIVLLKQLEKIRTEAGGDAIPEPTRGQLITDMLEQGAVEDDSLAEIPGTQTKPINLPEVEEQVLRTSPPKRPKRRTRVSKNIVLGEMHK